MCWSWSAAAWLHSNSQQGHVHATCPTCLACGAHCPACPPAFLPGVWCARVRLHSLPAASAHTQLTFPLLLSLHTPIRLQVLWGHARLRLDPPSPWRSQLLAAASAQVPRFTARDTAMLLWALASLGRCPEQQPQQQQPKLVAGLVGGLYLSSCKLRAATPQVGVRCVWEDVAAAGGCCCCYRLSSTLQLWHCLWAAGVQASTQYC